MKTYIFYHSQFMSYCSFNETEIEQTLQHVARGTDTGDLVVALYLLPGVHQSRGTAHVRTWMSPRSFIARNGKWTCSKKWPVPADLPGRFKLIRMRLDGRDRLYPRTDHDTYFWEFRYRSFTDHLATLFAHELHHFRRYHHDMHPREGEQSANRWALNHVRKLGYHVEGKKVEQRRKWRRRQTILRKTFPRPDPFVRFRNLAAGAQVVITHDPGHRYDRQTVTVVRPIRSNSKRMVVRTGDEKIWRWPMAWLKIPE